MSSPAPAPDMDRATYLAQLRAVVAALEAGDDAAGERQLDQLLRRRESGLFVSLARLTRELHVAIKDFNLDQRLQQLAGQDMPEACARLEYVAKLSEQAAHTTLDMVDSSRLQIAVMERCCSQLQPLLSGNGVNLVRQLSAATDALKGNFSAISQAQGYQDLSGQILRRVTDLVRSVEAALIKLLHATHGTGRETSPAEPLANASLAGPHVPGLSGSAPVSQTDADALLLELGF